MRWPSWLGGRRDFQGVTPEGQIPPRGGSRQGSILVNQDTAMRHSAVWACLRLRADLMSSFPLGVYRDVGGIPVAWTRPPVLVAPGGKRWPYKHWMWATQHDLDSTGNAIGVITEVNSLGLPSRIDLAPIRACTVVQRKGMTEPLYKIDGTEYPADKVWHERQFPVAGLPVGLSPLVYAAWSIGEYLSEQQFGLDWFGGSAVPKARMKNKAKVLKPEEITIAKQWYRDVIQNGDLLVHGNDWEYDFIQAQEAGLAWIEARKYGLADVCRFFGCPADLIDAAVSSGGTITYQSTQQRNLQFLIMQMAPAVGWREDALSTLLPAPRYVELDTDTLMRMDPVTLAAYVHARVADRTLTPNAARQQYYGLPPLTSADEAEFIRLFGEPRTVQPPQKVAGADIPHQVRDTLEQWVSGTAPTSPAPIGASHE